MSGQNFPAIVNRNARVAREAARVLAEVGGFDLHEVSSDRVEETVRSVARDGPRRILIAGGDGTLSTAARILANTGIQLAIMPAGTLNHLAKYLGIPEDLHQAALVARGEFTRGLDAGRVNDAIFLSTSSVGAYGVFVRRRERLEKRCGYHLASLIAGLQVLFRTPISRVTVDLEDGERSYLTPLVFVGIGERELRIPSMGGRSAHGKRGLHLMVVKSRTGARLAGLTLRALIGGIAAVSRSQDLDGVVVDHFMIEGPHLTASLDGELVDVEPTLHYQFLPDALVVVVDERRRSDRSPGEDLTLASHA
jgi:diacylglycerol kinase family enzyme